MAGIWDLTGQNIENTYQRVIQTPDGINYYDGTGSLVNIGAGGVTKIIAGTGISISPTTGLGDVTVNSLSAVYNTMTGSYGSFYDTGSYLATSATAIYSMSFSTTDISNGVYISGSDKTIIKFTNAGIYNIQFSAQFSNSDNTGTDVAIWLRKNDGSSINDLPDTTGTCTIPPFKAGQNGQTITSWNYYVSVSAGDFLQLLWHAQVANKVTLETIPAGVSPIHPRTPSVIFTAQRIDTFLSNTGSFSGSFIGEFIGTASYSSLTQAAGNNAEVQFNNNGILGASSAFTFETTGSFNVLKLDNKSPDYPNSFDCGIKQLNSNESTGSTNNFTTTKNIPSSLNDTIFTLSNFYVGAVVNYTITDPSNRTYTRTGTIFLSSDGTGNNIYITDQNNFGSGNADPTKAVFKAEYVNTNYISLKLYNHSGADLLVIVNVIAFKI